MYKSAFALVPAALAASLAFSTIVAAAEPVPCENMLKDVKAAAKVTKASDADKTKAAELQSKGLDRCKADDDAGADALFADALKLLGK